MEIMNVNELMVGDWVYKQNRMSPDENMSSMISATDLYRIQSCRGDFDFFPIPLTPEILEKNGMKLTHGIYVYCEDSGMQVTLFISTRNIFCCINNIYNSRPSVDIIIHYVHELQHALRLCGLNEFANNFKV